MAATRKISNITAFFMIIVALLFDLLQFLLTIMVITAPLSILVTFFALCIFGVWFAVLGVNYFSGRKVALKTLSAIGSVIVEMVPLIDGLPAITAGVAGVILGTRLENKAQEPEMQQAGNNRIRFGPQKMSAGNDNEVEEVQRAA
jgi:hypothetical protein